jgi:hypothetical protein
VLVLVLGQELQRVVLVLVLVLVLPLVLALERWRHRSLWQQLQVSSCCCASTARRQRFSRPARRWRSSSYQLFVRRQRSQALQKQATRPLY